MAKAQPTDSCAGRESFKRTLATASQQRFSRCSSPAGSRPATREQTANHQLLVSLSGLNPVSRQSGRPCSNSARYRAPRADHLMHLGRRTQVEAITTSPSCFSGETSPSPRHRNTFCDLAYVHTLSDAKRLTTLASSARSNGLRSTHRCCCCHVSGWWAPTRHNELSQSSAWLADSRLAARTTLLLTTIALAARVIESARVDVVCRLRQSLPETTGSSVSRRPPRKSSAGLCLSGERGHLYVPPDGCAAARRSEVALSSVVFLLGGRLSLIGGNLSVVGWVGGCCCHDVGVSLSLSWIVNGGVGWGSADGGESGHLERAPVNAFRMRLPTDQAELAASNSCNMDTALERIRSGCLCNEETSILQAVLPSVQVAQTRNRNIPNSFRDREEKGGKELDRGKVRVKASKEVFGVRSRSRTRGGAADAGAERLRGEVARAFDAAESLACHFRGGGRCHRECVANRRTNLSPKRVPPSGFGRTDL
ncbi:hypothetical protein BIW11_05028 [Tropilaelaps mercedesae]|uniref:Uncharacterized protein n=1 Tax=Tropilaelaps mercedesae TaxID=418985 RepID=A0A1V9WYB7_9ACAR|nr:hypothetical protein BIW11_05028 [Tropilaelaps mercedesae]